VKHFANLSHNLPVSEVQVLINHFYEKVECEQAMQCSDPDYIRIGSGLYPDWIRIQSGQWIQIRDSESGSRRAKMTHKNRNKLRNFHVLKCWMFSFEG
jgi:hypothetical protein